MDRDTTAKVKDSATPKDCVFCLPFCGLGESESLAARLKACGIQLLEQATPGQQDFAESLNRS